MKNYLVCALCLLCTLNTYAKDEGQHNWQADGGQLKVYFFYDLLNDFSVSVNDGLENRKAGWSDNELNFPIKQAGGLSLYVPYDGLKAVNGGQLLLEGSFDWQTKDQSIQFKNLLVRPVSRALRAGELTALEIVSDSGEVFFYLDHIHA
ncbi:MAG: hypothetical protein ACSHWU_09265, partial [Marinicella sp.]